MKTKYLFILYACLLPSVAFCWNDASSLRKYWGGGTLEKCKGHTIEIKDADRTAGRGACIGDSRKDNCRAWKDVNLGELLPGRDWIVSKPSKTNENDDESVMLMMIAHKITEHGAMFCPTQVEARNTKRKNAWTQYRDLSGGDESKCVWLCKTGWMGSTCDTVVSNDADCIVPKENVLKATNFDNYKILTSGANIEYDLPLFDFAQEDDCGHNKGTDEHDSFLAVNSWEPNGHGAFVRQFVVRADRTNWPEWDSATVIYPVSNTTDILVCQSGYKPNSLNKECEKIELASCTKAEQLEELGSDAEEYDEEEHIIEQSEDGDVELNCRESGYGFARGTKKCVLCDTTPMLAGKNENNECVSCPKGTIFSAKDTKNNYCTPARKITKDMLEFGNDANRKLDISQQCWTMAGTDYSNCVRNGK